jgi:Skp family chaperone for outer membrane proteins
MPMVRLISCALLAAMLLSLNARAADEAAATPFKIGVVDVKEVFDAYEKQKDQYAELRTKRDTMQKPIDELSAQITADKKTYDDGKDKLDADARRALEEKIEANVTRYKAEFDRAQQDIERQEKKMSRDLFEEIYLAIQEVSAQGNYHLVFKSGDTSVVLPGGPGGLLYHSTTLNMTPKVIEHLNGKYKKPK